MDKYSFHGDVKFLQNAGTSKDLRTALKVVCDVNSEYRRIQVKLDENYIEKSNFHLSITHMNFHLEKL